MSSTPDVCLVFDHCTLMLFRSCELPHCTLCLNVPHTALLLPTNDSTSILPHWPVICFLLLLFSRWLGRHCSIVMLSLGQLSLRSLRGSRRSRSHCRFYLRPFLNTFIRVLCLPSTDSILQSCSTHVPCKLQQPIQHISVSQH